MSIQTTLTTTGRDQPTRLSWWRTVLFGLQHVIVMYTGCVAVPLVFGAAMGLSKTTIGMLVNADLVVAGLVTILQAVGIKRVLGARMPVVAGASFTAVTPMILIGKEYGLTAVYGAMIAAGIFGVLVAVPFSRLLKFFPPVVRGAAITMIGLSLIGNAVSMIFEGGAADGPRLALAGGIILLILGLMRYGRGFLAQAAVLIALVVGTLVATAMSLTDFSAVAHAAWFGLPHPFLFGTPTFPIAGIISMCIVMLVIFTESTAYLLSIGETTGKPTTPAALSRGLAADGVSSMLAGVLTSFPDTVFSQNVSLVRMTGITSRRVVAVAGAILVFLGLIPKMGELVASLPGTVIGAVSLVMFATVAGMGISTLSKVNFDNTNNFMIASIALAVGMIPIVAPNTYAHFSPEIRIIFGGAISSTVIVAFALNLVFNHLRPRTRTKVESS
jgi:xanthine permease